MVDELCVQLWPGTACRTSLYHAFSIGYLTGFGGPKNVLQDDAGLPAQKDRGRTTPRPSGRLSTTSDTSFPAQEIFLQTLQIPALQTARVSL